jgi:hypothetical protein
MKSAMVIILLVVFSGGFSAGAIAADESLEALHIVDYHVHTAGLGYGGSGAFLNEEMRENFRVRFFLRWVGVTEQELEAEGDQLVLRRLSKNIARSRYVDQAVVLAMDGIVDHDLHRVGCGAEDAADLGQVLDRVDAVDSPAF